MKDKKVLIKDLVRVQDKLRVIHYRRENLKKKSQELKAKRARILTDSDLLLFTPVVVENGSTYTSEEISQGKSYFSLPVAEKKAENEHSWKHYAAPEETSFFVTVLTQRTSTLEEESLREMKIDYKNEDCRAILRNIMKKMMNDSSDSSESEPETESE